MLVREKPHNSMTLCSKSLRQIQKLMSEKRLENHSKAAQLLKKAGSETLCSDGTCTEVRLWYKQPYGKLAKFCQEGRSLTMGVNAFYRLFDEVNLLLARRQRGKLCSCAGDCPCDQVD